MARGALTYQKAQTLKEKLTRLQELRADAIAKRNSIVTTVQFEGRDNLSSSETVRFKKLSAQITNLDREIADVRDDIARSGRDNATASHVARASARIGGGGTDWATRAATAMHKMGGEHRAVTSGSIDVPTLVEPDVTPKARPERLLDLLVNRTAIPGNAFEYFRQSVRTNAADTVADSATKPTSTFTVEPITDRARVIAHLSEPIPLRLLADHDELRMFLDAEMRAGVLDALEAQIVSGSGTGEDFTGILTATGTTAVAFDTSLHVTLRSALTAAQTAGERPTAWVLSPADAETLDLTLETSGSGFLLDGVNASNAGSGNVFGNTLPRVVSPSIPAGTALLADWSKLRLYVREDVRIDVDTAGADLFDKNLAKLRAEGRFGMGLLRPSAFFKIDLTA
ncbi:hypothetical protein AU187_24430 [Mycobacterium sp. IS-1556]|nr:hypothetical protein AU187_24430 [Mycobacterium sp. IS-1556]